MLKKTVCFITMLTMLLTSFVNVYAVLPQTMGGQGQGGDSGPVLVFHDDFMHGTGYWNLEGVAIEPGKMSTPANTYSSATFYDQDWNLKNAEYRIKFSPIEFNTNGICIIHIGVQPDWFGIVIRDNGVINCLPVDVGEQGLGKFPMEYGKVYELNINVSDGTAVVSIRNDGQESFTALGTVNNVGVSNGALKIYGMSYQVDFTDIAVYDTSSKSLSFQQKYLLAEPGKDQMLSVNNKTGKELVFESSDPETVEVDEAGVVSAKKAGEAIITAKTKDGKSADTCRVRTYIPVSAVAFHQKENTLRVGETEIINGQFLPNNASNQSFIYTCSNPDVVQMDGGSNKWQVITAKAPGNATVTMTSPDGLKATYEVTVVPKETPAVNTAEFSLSGFQRKIPEAYFGVHYSNLMETGYSMGYVDPTYTEEKERLASELIKDIGFSCVRSYWTWWNWRTGSGQDDNGPFDGPNHTTLEQIYKTSSDGGADQILSFSAYSTVDDMVDEFKEIKRVAPAGAQIRVEYGNETYAINEVDRVPTIEVYVQRLRELSERIKAIDPTVKIGVPILCYELERAIFNDPYNYPNNEDNWEYTQGIRALTWNAVLSENADCFDAVIPHMYSQAGILRTTQTNFIKNTSIGWIKEHLGEKRQSYMFPGKEMWQTEYNTFPLALSIGDPVVMNKVQVDKSLGCALSAGFHLMNLLDTPAANTSVHYLIDPQGFGLVQPGEDENGNMTLDKLPHYYVYKELGNLFKNYEYFYGLNLEEGKVEKVALGFNQETQYADMQDVYAYGFGDENGVRKIAIINMVENPAKVSVGGTTLKPIRRYWDDTPVPNLFNSKVAYTALPEEMPYPEDITDEPEAAVITVKPFSLTIVEVNGGEKSKILDSAETKLGRNAKFTIDSTRAYRDKSRNDIDLYNVGIKPRMIDGEVYLPLRPIADLMDNYLVYTSVDDNTAEVELLEYRDLQTEKETDADVSKVTSVETGLELINAFYYNSIVQFNRANQKSPFTAIMRDEERTFEEKDAPILIDSTTYVTPELAAEMFGLYVNYYDDGLIVLSENNARLDENELQSIEAEFVRP
ncbi:MAG: Ig domain-containing protein [Clostridia bacterium]|nr:Ig domain-containing protein [Clostridia bacterium]